VLDPDVMLPAAGQGALAVETREDDARVRAIVAAIESSKARSEVSAERSCLRRLGAGCQAPVGALAEVKDGKVRLRAAVALVGRIEWVNLVGVVADADAVGISAAEKLLGQLGLPTLRGVMWTPEESKEVSAP
jgi:hydroxymethylbilane synthase